LIKNKALNKRHRNIAVGTLEERRAYWLKRNDLAPDEPLRKFMIDAIDLAITGKIRPIEIFVTAILKYEAMK
jgi:hypothetical protein